jgi:two-component system, cell cycle sensor histidine kinase and response regulator CckA
MVEDERIVALDLAATLKELGYTVEASVSSGEAAIEQAMRLRPNLVLMDIRLAGKLDGIEAAQVIRKELDIPVIYLTAHSDETTLARAKGTGPFGYIVKPFKAPDLHCAIELALHKHEIEARLREREAWLTTTLRSIGDGVLATDPENRVKFLNPVAEALTGWSSAEALGRVTDDILTLVSNKTGRPLASPLQQALLDRTARSTDEDTDLVDRSGNFIPIDDSAAPILGDRGEVLGGVLVFRDISERRRIDEEVRGLGAELERRVIERTAQLELANKELESFSYSVAHDLRAPLRGIDGFSAILIENHTANLGPDGLDCLNRIRAGADRMRQLIDDLLRLARVVRCDKTRQKVNLTQLAATTLAELKAACKDRQVEVIFESDVTVEGDRALLTIVLENLLGNAWKFTRKVAAPKIEFGSYLDDGNRVCYVRDNGAGFDMKYAEMIYGVFQRLHTQKEFEGTGVGLAIAERIIHRHGGLLWAESAPDKGATFYFMIPAEPGSAV